MWMTYSKWIPQTWTSSRPCLTVAASTSTPRSWTTNFLFLDQMMELLPLINWHMWMIVFVSRQPPVLIDAFDWRMLQGLAWLWSLQCTGGTERLSGPLSDDAVGSSRLLLGRAEAAGTEPELRLCNLFRVPYLGEIVALYFDIDQGLLRFPRLYHLASFMLLRASRTFTLARLSCSPWYLRELWLLSCALWLFAIFVALVLLFWSNAIGLFHKLSLHTLSVLFESI